MLTFVYLMIIEDDRHQNNFKTDFGMSTVSDEAVRNRRNAIKAWYMFLFSFYHIFTCIAGSQIKLNPALPWFNNILAPMLTVNLAPV